MARYIEIKTTIRYPGETSTFNGVLLPGDTYDSVYKSAESLTGTVTKKEFDAEIIEAICNTFAADIENDLGITDYDLTWEIVDKKDYKEYTNQSVYFPPSQSDPLCIWIHPESKVAFYVTDMHNGSFIVHDSIAEVTDGYSEVKGQTVRDYYVKKNNT